MGSRNPGLARLDQASRRRVREFAVTLLVIGAFSAVVAPLADLPGLQKACSLASLSCALAGWWALTRMIATRQPLDPLEVTGWDIGMAYMAMSTLLRIMARLIAPG